MTGQDRQLGLNGHITVRFCFVLTLLCRETSLQLTHITFLNNNKKTSLVLFLPSFLSTLADQTPLRVIRAGQVRRVSVYTSELNLTPARKCCIVYTEFFLLSVVSLYDAQLGPLSNPSPILGVCVSTGFGFTHPGGPVAGV